MLTIRIILASAVVAGAVNAQRPAPGAAGADSTTGSTPGQAADSLRITRAEAVAAALAHNPQLEIARAQIGQARARVVEARSIPDPAVTASFDQQPGLFRSNGPAGEKNLGVTLAIPFPQRLRLQGAIAGADVRSFESFYALLRQEIAAQTSEAYDSLLVAVVHRADLTEARTLAADFLKRTQARFQGGTAPRLDVIRATVGVAQASSDLIANARDVENARTALARLMGDASGVPIAPADSLQANGELPPEPQIEAVALRRRPELASIAAQRAGARASTSLAKEFWLPDITLGVGRDYTQPEPALFSTGLAFPFPLFPWQHTRGEIAEAQFRERELAAAEQDTRAAVIQDVRGAYANAVTAMQQAAFIRDELLPAARAAYNSASASYTLGGSSALDVQDARRQLLDAESQYADALIAATVSRAELERAVSVPLATLAPESPR